MLRHFAFYDVNTVRRASSDGLDIGDVCICLREWKGDVPEPPAEVMQELDPVRRQQMLTAWQDFVSGRLPGEICLDVTSFDYPEGDFCWTVFRPYEQTEPGKRGLLDWPFMHLFIEIRRADGYLAHYVESPRPVRSTVDWLIVDVTGTPWEVFYRTVGAVFGAFRVRQGRLVFEPDRLHQPRQSAQLVAADSVLDPIDLTPIRQPAHVPAERGA